MLRVGKGRRGRGILWASGAVLTPAPPAANNDWSAGPGQNSGEIYLTVNSQPDPGDAVTYDDGFGEITDIEIQADGGAWASGAVPTAASLPVSILIDPSQAGTLWQDAAGTIPASVDGVVGRIDDAKTAGTFYLTSGEIIHRYSNGRRFLETNTSAAVLNKIILPTSTLQNRTSAAVVAAFRQTGDGTTGGLFEAFFTSGTGTSGIWYQIRVTSGGNIQMRGRRVAADTLQENPHNGAFLADDTLVSVQLNYSGATTVNRTWAVERTSATFQTAGNSANVAANRVELMSHPFKGRLFGFALGYGLTATHVRILEDYFSRSGEVLG